MGGVHINATSLLPASVLPSNAQTQLSRVLWPSAAITQHESPTRGIPVSLDADHRDSSPVNSEAAELAREASALTKKEWSVLIRAPIVEAAMVLNRAADKQLVKLSQIAADMWVSLDDFAAAAKDPDPARFLAKGRGGNDGFPSAAVVREAWKLLKATRRSMASVPNLDEGTCRAYELLVGYYLGTYEATDLERRLRHPRTP